ncbi:MAG: butyrate kinase [Lachnospiraceae bacterium]|nr:butyrate kinase [Lachnospiraceae bacterium]
MYRILIINPGSTSTKIGVYEDENQVFDKTLRHTTEEIAQFATIADQKDFRRNIILDALKENNIDVKSIQVVVGRGGLLRPIPGGTYEVNDKLYEDCLKGVQGQHASNLGGILAKDIADEIGGRAFIVDPVCVDELAPVARLSGCAEIERTSIFHALNQKAIAKRYAREQGVPYDSLNLIVVHMGGGVSVGAHKNGRVVDVFNALDGDGAFSPERAGAVPVGPLVKLCFSGKYTEKEVYRMLVGNGGLNSYLGTNDFHGSLVASQNGDEKAKAVIEAFCYQIAKNVGAMAAVLEGKVDQILFTGGIAYNPEPIEEFRRMVGFIAPITVYPGEDELLALAQGGLRVMNGEEEVCVY